ncbi:MAG TPA: hypothetical protein VFJ16_00325 [Longimicrobium sp.]|nr:hypothetical protein [Longimicrobium sp.]
MTFEDKLDPGGRDRLRQGLNVVLAVTQMVTPYLARATGVGVPIQEQFSTPTWVTPAGYAFSIWGPIFIASLAYAVYQARPGRRADPLLRRVGWLTAAAFAACTAWAVAAQLQAVWLTVPLIAVITGTLVAALVRVAGWREPLALPERWLVAAPLGVYAGWVTVATVANVAVALAFAGVRDLVLPGRAWGVVLMVAAGAIGAFVTLRTRRAGYALAVAWALAAIAVARAQDAPEVAAAAGGAAVLVLLVLLRSRSAARRPTAA